MSPNLKDSVESVNSDKIFKELVGKIKTYNPNVDVKILDKAYKATGHGWIPERLDRLQPYLERMM